MNSKVHVTLRVPKELHEEIMNTNEHSTKNAKYLARLRPVSQTNTTEETLAKHKELLNSVEDIKAGIEAILNEIQQ